ncbi:hypothetical protein H3C70_00790 [Patescibacteria group bacterium]|nr:hypothetical protein [Patescibacteria group bacterium]
MSHNREGSPDAPETAAEGQLTQKPLGFLEQLDREAAATRSPIELVPGDILVRRKNTGDRPRSSSADPQATRLASEPLSEKTILDQAAEIGEGGCGCNCPRCRSGSGHCYSDPRCKVRPPRPR